MGPEVCCVFSTSYTNVFNDHYSVSVTWYKVLCIKQFINFYSFSLYLYNILSVFYKCHGILLYIQSGLLLFSDNICVAMKYSYDKDACNWLHYEIINNEMSLCYYLINNDNEFMLFNQDFLLWFNAAKQCSTLYSYLCVFNLFRTKLN